MSMMSGRGSEKAAAGMGGSMTLNHLKVNSKFVLLNKFSEIRQQKNEKRL
jgi:hypothetical protein